MMQVVCLALGEKLPHVLVCLVVQFIMHSKDALVNARDYKGNWYLGQIRKALYADPCDDTHCSRGCPLHCCGCWSTFDGERPPSVRNDSDHDGGAYLVHFFGWDSRYDEWMCSKRLRACQGNTTVMDNHGLNWPVLGTRKTAENKWQALIGGQNEWITLSNTKFRNLEPL